METRVSGENGDFLECESFQDLLEIEIKLARRGEPIIQLTVEQVKDLQLTLQTFLDEQKEQKREERMALDYYPIGTKVKLDFDVIAKHFMLRERTSLEKYRDQVLEINEILKDYPNGPHMLKGLYIGFKKEELIVIDEA